MLLVVILLAVLVLVLVLYDKLRPSLPPQFQLGANPGAPGSALVQVLPKPEVPAALPTSPNRWLVISDGTNVRASREFRTPIKGEAHTYDAPLLYFSCYQKHLYGWLDTRLAAAPSLRDPLHVEVQVNDQPVELWARQEGQTLAIPDAGKFLHLLEKKNSLTLTLAFSEAPRQTLALSTDPMKPLTSALAACRK